MRENRPYGLEGGESGKPDFPTPMIPKQAQGTGAGESIHNLAEAHCTEMNRPVRTRTPGGVGGASEQSGSLSLSRSWFATFAQRR